MMTQPKLRSHNHPNWTDFAAKTDGTGADFASVLGRVDGSILVPGEDSDGGT